MSITVIAMYDNAGKTQQVIQDLNNAGFNKDSIEVLRSDGQSGDALIGKFTGHGIDKGEAGLYAEAIRRGRAFVVVDAPDERAENALAILERHGAHNMDNLAAELGLQQTRQREEGSETIPVVEEQVSVGKRRVLRGGVRVTSTVTERPVEETVRLREETVDVERKQADRKLSPQEADKAFQEKTVEMTETAEEAAVKKEARVVEEVALRKTAEEHEEKIHETARRTDVKVEQVEPQKRSEGQR